MSEMDYSRPSDAFVKGIDVHTLLPQQEPFVMIGSLEHFDMKTVVTSTEVKADNIFVENGVMEAAGLIENIAQTCAARIGYLNVYVLKKGVQIGFIGAIRDLTVNNLPKVGETITTTISIEEEVFGMILASATITVDGTSVASTGIKIAVKEEA